VVAKIVLMAITIRLNPKILKHFKHTCLYDVKKEFYFLGKLDIIVS